MKPMISCSPEFDILPEVGPQRAIFEISRGFDEALLEAPDIIQLVDKAVESGLYTKEEVRLALHEYNQRVKESHRDPRTTDY